MLTVTGISGLPEIEAGDDLAAMILARADLMDGDIVVVTSKIVSKAEGRLVPEADREAAIAAETVRVVAERGPVRIVENRLGIVAAAAGIDASNVPEGYVLLLPVDPDASARRLAERLREVAHVGVLVSDTLGRPWRLGQTDAAIGAAGVTLFERPDRDADGRPLAVTMACVADELCAAAELVKPKDGHVPVAVVRGRADLVGSLELPGARSIVRPSADDLFRTGR